MVQNLCRPSLLTTKSAFSYRPMNQNMMRRIHTIARHAKETDVRVMIDAEQSYFQVSSGYWVAQNGGK